MNFLNIMALKKSYNRRNVLNNINIEIKKGEFVTLLGPSGCGKSTLLKCIAGLTDIDDGEIYIDGKLINKLKPNKRDISMVFQSYALFPNMTAKENIEFGLKMKKVPNSEMRKRVEAAINLVDLNGYEDHYPDQLSGGQQQRVALARALIIEPKLLLLDEPLSALDAKTRKNLRLQIRKIQKQLKITTIFVTHDQEEALMISDRILLMHGGSIVQEGTPENIYSNPKNEFAAGFIGNYNIIDKEKLKELLKNDNHAEIDGKIFALRPEAIHIVELEQNKNADDGIVTSGTILDRIILGNLIRYIIKLDKFTLNVDILNRKNVDIFNIDQAVKLFIPKEELKKLA